MSNGFNNFKNGINVGSAASNPSDGVEGDVYYNSVGVITRQYINGAWRDVVNATSSQTLTNKTLTTPVISSISNTGTLTLPTSSDTLVGRATTDTLTNKTLTAPVIATIVNSGTLTLPTSSDTLVGKATTDTLTNKSISGSTNTITNVSLTSGVTGTLPVTNGGTGATSFTAYSVICGGTTSTGAHQNVSGLGSSGQVLMSNGASALPSWGTVLTNPMTTGGDVIYGGASGTPTRLANGTSGQFLTSAGSTSAPTWTSLTGITGSQLANNTITGTQIASSVNLPGSSVEANSKKVICSNTNASKGLVIIRGAVDLTMTTATQGEGYSVSAGTTGNCTLNWTTAFADTPVVVATVQVSSPAGAYCNVQGPSTNAVQINCYNSSGSNTNQAFQFIAIGIQL